jgi:acyl-CoA thioester hydrolase
MSFEVTIEIPVQTYDIDFAGIVSNIVYIRWLEDLRLRLLDEYLPLNGLMENGWAPVLIETQIIYKRPIKLFDKVTGRAWISNTTKIKWQVTTEFVCNNQLAASAQQTGALINLQSGRPVPFPDLKKV